MTASGEQPKIRSERRIIERPRLIKLLDESDARTILLLAPAGYGKTTLARQWAKTLNGAIWISLTPAHRDVARLAEDIAAGIDRLGGEASQFIGEYLRSRRNPQRSAREVAKALAEHLAPSRAQWLILDDYHDLGQAEEAEELLRDLQELTRLRFVVTARTRPVWATARKNVYGEVFELDRSALAMDEDESALVLGKRNDRRGLFAQSEGWPAALGLAASLPRNTAPEGAVPAQLYGYFAEELYGTAPAPVRAALLSLALVPELTNEAVENEIGSGRSEVIEQIRDLGFLSTEPPARLHPLIRDFLLQKLALEDDAAIRAATAVAKCVAQEQWDRAFELILRFNLNELVEETLEAAYGPLRRSGHLGTLSAFALAVRKKHHFPPPAVDLVDAEVALRDGAQELAQKLATRVLDQLPASHALVSNASAIMAQTRFNLGDLPGAARSYAQARSTATHDRDEADALYGWAMASTQGEIGEARRVLDQLYVRRHTTPLDLARYSIAELARRRFDEGLAGSLELDEVVHILERVEDPRARSSFMYSAAYALALRAEYDEAFEFASSAAAEVEMFDLDFARPYANWNLGLINLGLRRFGAAERALQHVEDELSAQRIGFHVLNARILRMRLALQTGELGRALGLVEVTVNETAIPSIQAEHLAMEAMCLAVAGRHDDALNGLRSAESLTRAVEVRVLAKAVRAIVAVSLGEDAPAMELLRSAEDLGAWDPVVLALRVSSELCDLLANDSEAKHQLEWLYQQSHDGALARRAGFRTRSTRKPEEILSPREMEVLQLLARGFRNREIAKALVISDSTTKVHVRHILEKMGARTRTEAVARYEMFATGRYSGSSTSDET